jgi:hypothetical protein
MIDLILRISDRRCTNNPASYEHWPFSARWKAHFIHHTFVFRVPTSALSQATIRYDDATNLAACTKLLHMMKSHDPPG